MKADIAILGAGPRGLAVALQAVEKGLQTLLIDTEVAGSWSSSSMAPNLQMRSPVSFDLVTRVSYLQQYSFASYLEVDCPYTESQQELESCETFAPRSKFYKYCLSVFKELQKQSNFNFLEYRGKVTEPQKVLVEGEEISATNIVLAVGSVGTKQEMTWIEKTPIKEKATPVSEVLRNKPSGEKIAVIGSAQFAAEMVQYLAPDNHVIWCQKKRPRVTQYPAPSWTERGQRGALGAYYRRLPGTVNKLAYLSSVKEWQPSITPLIEMQLRFLAAKYDLITFSKYEDLYPVLSADRVLLLTGLANDYKDLPIDFPIDSNPYIPQFAKLTLGFKTSQRSLHITGLQAIAYDGPRQASVVSAGETAKEILDWI